MKIINLFIILFFPLLLQNKFSGKVVGVMDGDTIEVLLNNQPQRIRLYGIDCPEKKQDFGAKAKEFTSSACFGKEVEIISFGEDRYGRTLGNVKLPDGKILNQELVREGLAWHYKHFSKDTVLARLEVEARNMKRGLWVLRNAMAPWEYRQLTK